MRLIVGLGNPGRRYQATPHNIGFEVVEELAARNGLRWTRARMVDGEFADGRIAGEQCILLKPATYMNVSGRAVAPIARGEGLDPAAQLLVVVDDVALPLGRLRLRPGGSSGGHRGLDSIVASLQTRQFPRLRCGVRIGEEEVGGDDLADYVLAKWPKSARETVAGVTWRAADAVEAWLSREISEVMTEYNSA